MTTNEEIYAAIERTRAEIEKWCKGLQGKQTNLEEKMGKANTKITKNKEEIKKVSEKLNRQEDNMRSEKRKRNIILSGIEETETNRAELEAIAMNIINQKLKVETALNEIDAIQRLGKEKRDRPRPILVAFTATRKAWDVLNNRKHLKGTNIFLKEDLPKEVEEKRRKLYPLLKKHREEGKHAIIKYNKLIVDGTVIRLENESDSEDEDEEDSEEETTQPTREEEEIKEPRIIIPKPPTSTSTKTQGTKATTSKTRTRSTSKTASNASSIKPYLSKN